MNLQIGLTPPQITRIVWHSLKAEREWRERLNEIQREWSRVERESVLAGIRECSLQPLSQGFAYQEVVQWAHNNGLFVRPVRAVGNFVGFAHRYTEGEDLYVTAIARSREALEEPEKHLGYPRCCRKFFEKYFPAIIDPMWQWAGEREAIFASPYSNPLLRYVNARFSPHIPCSPDCKKSIKLGERMCDLMKPEIAGSVEELLLDPIEWSCYRGIAIVKTPHFRLIIGSNPASRKYVVRSQQQQLIQLTSSGAA